MSWLTKETAKMHGKCKNFTSVSRRQFTVDFKQDAVQMLLDGHSSQSIVDRLGLSRTSLLYRWKRDLLRAVVPLHLLQDSRESVGGGTQESGPRTRHSENGVGHSWPKRVSDVVAVVD